jgi:hypothetical protein
MRSSTAVPDVFKEENRFYQYCDPTRISKFLAHAKLYEMSLGLPGHFVEAGVFRGASFCRFRKLGKLLHPDHLRRFIGFDVFGRFPDPKYGPDKKVLTEQWKVDGDTSIGREELLEILKIQGLHNNVDLIKGDISETLPRFLKEHQEMSFSMVNVDLDIYEPIKATLEHIFPRVVRGGIILLDDYEGYPGAKKAVDEYLAANKRTEVIRKFQFSYSPCYLIKE